MADNYRALTRKYRPQSFEDVVSQEHVSSTLKNAIRQNRLSHAYMFCGPRGVGKTTMARVLARSINQIGENVDGEALSQTLNVVEIDAASNNKVEDVHHLREIVRVPPQSGNYKIFIIDEVHMLSKAAFNALLKTLEEPPPHAIFIFATTEPHKVLPTILSRVQRFDFKRISVDEIVIRLKEICGKEGITIDDESLHTIAKKADGALRDALGLMDQAIAFCGVEIAYDQLVQALNVVGNDQLFEFTKAISGRDSQAGLLLIDRLMKEGVDIQEFLVSMTTHLRNLYVAKQGGRMHLVEATEDTKQRYLDAAKSFSEEDLMRMLHLVSEAQIKIRDVQQPRIHFEILMLKLIHMSRAKELSELLNGLNQLKKNANNSVNKLKGSESVENEQTDQVTSSEPADTEKSLVSKTDTDTDLQSSQSSEARELSAATEKNVLTTDADEEDIDTLLTGKPSLGFAKNNRPPNGAVDKKKSQKNEVPEPVVKLNGIEDIEACWDQFLNHLKKNCSKTLFHQVEAVRLKNLKGTELFVSVNNMFAANLLEEHRVFLSTLLKETVGIHIRLKCVVEREKKTSAESLNPYDRFRELQKKDAHLKTIVELFGAELEY
jgi:DNA polymerase III subunit gamma/tau